MKNSKKIYLVLFGMAAATAGSIFAATWTEPNSAPPNGNTAAPINVSSSAQTKSGNLTIGDLTIGGNTLSINNGTPIFKVGVGGNGVGANKYCNLGGTNCKTIEDLSTPNINLSDYLTIVDANERFCYENPVGSGNWINCPDPGSGNGDDVYVTTAGLNGSDLILTRNDSNNLSVDLSSLSGGGGGGTSTDSFWKSEVIYPNMEDSLLKPANSITIDENGSTTTYRPKGINTKICNKDYHNSGEDFPGCLRVKASADNASSANKYHVFLDFASVNGGSGGNLGLALAKENGKSLIGIGRLYNGDYYPVFAHEQDQYTTLRYVKNNTAYYMWTAGENQKDSGTYYQTSNLPVKIDVSDYENGGGVITGPIPGSSSSKTYKFSVNGNAIIDGGGLYIHKVGSKGGDLYADGNVIVTGGVNAQQFAYSSDKRLKKEISTTKGLDVITKLRGVDFTWKNSNKKDIGLIAQEVEEVLPNLVSTDKKSGLKSVQYGNLVAPLIEAVKEQQKQIEQLEAKVEELQKQN